MSAVGEEAQPCLAHSPTALNELNLAVAPPFVGQMKKNFRSPLSTPLGADMAKKPSHATVPLMTEQMREEINKPV